MNNDLIERGTDAIFEVIWPQTEWNEGETHCRRVAKTAAQAAYSAMQGEVAEPTDAMIDLAERAIEEWLTAHDGEEIDCRALARIAVMQGEVGRWRNDCEYLLACIDQSNEAQAPVDESDPEDIAAIDEIRAALAASPPVDQGRIERRLVELYLADRQCVAAICDEQLDRSGNLLGYLRDAALTNKGANP